MRLAGPGHLGEIEGHCEEGWSAEDISEVTTDRARRDDVCWCSENPRGWCATALEWGRTEIFRDGEPPSRRRYWHQADAPASWSSRRHGKRAENELDQSRCYLYANALDLLKDQDQGHIIDIYRKTINKHGEPTS